jgi:hypothetical protein
LLVPVLIALTTATVAADMIQECFWEGGRGESRIALFVPRTWWRYLTSTPVTLGIVSAYAASLNW